MCLSVDDVGSSYFEGDPILMAAAPALVDALIAEKRENQRIRKGLEKAREIYRDDTYPGSKGVVVRITRILEGNG
ncbi:hypothetical protein cgR_p0003 (plasmid) [Corynebacterium glutamicum R]|uniref:Uncharacterized protein n=2 Tax=Corynebacterium glutamicum TaxID=1718 RepID=A0AB72VF51_CORGB|nr:hypothetical protein cgR_p0003 [Corynebacterium glutamicum R]